MLAELSPLELVLGLSLYVGIGIGNACFWRYVGLPDVLHSHDDSCYEKRRDERGLLMPGRGTLDCRVKRMGGGPLTCWTWLSNGLLWPLEICGLIAMLIIFASVVGLELADRGMKRRF